MQRRWVIARYVGLFSYKEVLAPIATVGVTVIARYVGLFSYKTEADEYYLADDELSPGMSGFFLISG